MNRMTMLRVALLAAATLPAVLCAAERVSLIKSEGDLVPRQLMLDKRDHKPEVDRSPAAFAWALDPLQSLERPAPHVAKSREYWRDLSAAELSQGAPVHTTAPGALLRLSLRAEVKRAGIDPSALVLLHRGREYRGAAAFDQIADGEALKAAGIGAPEGSVVLRLREELGAGEFQLVLPKAAGGALLHVFEPRSEIVLSLHSAQHALLQGGTLEVFGALETPRPLSGELVGTIVAPNGRLFDLDFQVLAQGGWKAITRVDAAAGAGDGLWEVHVTLRDRDGRLQRDARTAFAAAVPGARLGATATVQTKRDAGLLIDLPVEVAAAARYDVSGVLYATAADGAQRPIAIAHSAAWLDAGTRALSLQFDANLVGKAGFSGPYEIRDLRLVDQGSLGLVEQRARALRFELN